MNFSFKAVLPLFITFFVLTVIIFAANFLYAEKGIDYVVVMGANCLFFFNKPFCVQDTIPGYV